MTVAVLLVRAGLSAPNEPTTALAPTTTRPATTAAPTTTRGTTTRTATAEEPEFYTVERGDTFGTIADRFGTTVERLQELNPGVDTTSLRIGQRIRVQ